MKAKTAPKTHPLYPVGAEVSGMYSKGGGSVLDPSGVVIASDPDRITVRYSSGLERGYSGAGTSDYVSRNRVCTECGRVTILDFCYSNNEQGRNIGCGSRTEIKAAP